MADDLSDDQVLIMCVTCRDYFRSEKLYKDHFSGDKKCKMILEAGHGQFKKKSTISLDKKIHLLEKKVKQEESMKNGGEGEGDEKKNKKAKKNKNKKGFK